MDPWSATYEEVAADLAEHGYAAEANAVMGHARNEPGRLAFTGDRHAWAAYREADGTWLTGSGHRPGLEPKPEATREVELEAR